MAAIPASDNYDYLRRRGSVMSERIGSKPGSVSPRRKPLRQQSARASNGTVSTANSMSTGGLSAATHITQPPSYSKKFVVVGDGGCGKTCLMISYSQGYFPEVSFVFDISSLKPRIFAQRGIEIRTHRIRKLHYTHIPCTHRKDGRTGFVGYGRARGI